MRLDSKEGLVVKKELCRCRQPTSILGESVLRLGEVGNVAPELKCEDGECDDCGADGDGVFEAFMGVIEATVEG